MSKFSLSYHRWLAGVAMLLSSCYLWAQPVPGRSIEVAVGYGLSVPYEDSPYEGEGFYLQGEYVVAYNKWFGVRPYAGLILTSDTQDEPPGQPDYSVTTNAFLLGGKVRVAAPVPWVAPFLEAGLGMSIGSLETFIPGTSLEKKGIQMHIPFALGLAVGPRNQIELAFTYYYHPSAEQFAGAFALGLSFPLKP